MCTIDLFCVGEIAIKARKEERGEEGGEGESCVLY